MSLVAGSLARHPGNFRNMPFTDLIKRKERQKEYSRRYYEKHKAKVIERSKRRRITHPKYDVAQPGYYRLYETLCDALGREKVSSRVMFDETAQIEALYDALIVYMRQNPEYRKFSVGLYRMEGKTWKK